jgi:phosphotransferase system IIB component
MSLKDVMPMAETLRQQYEDANGVIESGEKIAGVLMVVCNPAQKGWQMVSGADAIAEIAANMARYMSGGYEPIGLIRYESFLTSKGKELRFSSKILSKEVWAQALVNEAMETVKAMWRPQ